MGSEKVYLQPILAETMAELDTSMSVMPAVSDNIAEMTAQLNETTRILMNMMGNQGLELHQQAYNGASFSALELKQLIEPHLLGTGTGYMADLTCRDSGNLEVTSEYITFGKPGTANIELVYYAWNTRHIKFKISTQNSVAYSDASVEVDGVSYPATITGGYYGQDGIFECDLSEAPQETTPVIKFKATASGEFITKISELEINGETATIKGIPKLKFNSANALAPEIVPGGAPQNVAANAVIIKLPDIQSVGSWATFLINGNIEASLLQLCDYTTTTPVAQLPAATSDISSLTQTTNLGLRVQFSGTTNVINSIAQRYY